MVTSCKSNTNIKIKSDLKPKRQTSEIEIEIEFNRNLCAKQIFKLEKTEGKKQKETKSNEIQTFLPAFFFFSSFSLLIYSQYSYTS